MYGKSALVVFIILSIHIYDALRKNMRRVAFIFSGSVRSFIYPGVHESIRNNLVISFCPPTKCIADIFAKTSATDNQHEATQGNLEDSRGVIVRANTTEIQLAERAISRLQIHNMQGILQGHLDIEWVELNSSRELSEMETAFPSRDHQIFRDLDYRRYSTNFHCWSNYERAKRHEANRSITYDWFVKARFDMAFGHPVKPLSYWSANKMWLPDKGVLLVPDTFALVPAQFADSYFSMKKMIKKGVMCLGGPNMDKKTLERENLVLKGYSEADLRYVAEMKCEGTGFSETILFRKLTANGISTELKTLDFAPFFLVTIRKPSFAHFCELMTETCGLLDVLRDSRLSNAASGPGCLAFVNDLKLLTASNYSACTAPHTSQPAQYSGDSCPLNKQVSDWSYMPFRVRVAIKSGGGCLTADKAIGSGQSLGLTIQPCVDHENSTERGVCRRVNATYSISQVFSFFPLRQGPQPIRLHSHNGVVYCLSSNDEDADRSEGEVSLATCAQNNRSQAIIVDLVGRRWSKRSEGVRLGGVVSDRHLFANKPILRDREFVRIRHSVSGHQSAGTKLRMLSYRHDGSVVGPLVWRNEAATATVQSNVSEVLPDPDYRGVFMIERCRL